MRCLLVRAWKGSLVEFIKLFGQFFGMRLVLDDVIQELKLRLEESRSLRSKVFLKDALSALQSLKDSEKTH